MSNAITMTGRSVRLATRNLEALLISAILPIMIMLLFVYLFGGAIRTGSAQYVDYVVPGVLLLCVGYVSALTAVGVTVDMKEGIIDRFRSLDVSGAAVMTGHVAGSLLRNTLSASLVIGVALLIGFRPAAGPIEWLAAIGLLALFILAISWAGAAFGLVAGTPEGAGAFGFFVMFLPYPSSGFVPVETMPGWLQAFAEHQPLTPVITTLRGLYLGQPIGGAGTAAVAWCLGIMAAGMVASTVLFRRKTA